MADILADSKHDVFEMFKFSLVGQLKFSEMSTGSKGLYCPFYY